MIDSTETGDGDRARERGAGNAHFRLHEHPWLTLLAVLVFEVLAILLVGLLFGVLDLPDSPVRSFVQTTAFHLLFVLVFAPYLLRLPSGRQSLSSYFDEIRLTRVRPVGRLILLALSCSLILVVCQATGVIVYRLTLGEPLTLEFVLRVFDVTSDLPPDSASLLVSLPSVLEEVTFRGVLLFSLLYTFTKRKAIVASAAAFGLIHLLNLTSGRELVWVLGQVGWAFLLGLFYGYLVLRTDSLLPAMIVHYLGNVFVGSLTEYLQATASVEMQALYGVVFTFGLVPTALMIVWVRFFASRRLPRDRMAGSGP